MQQNDIGNLFSFDLQGLWKELTDYATTIMYKEMIQNTYST